MEKLKAEVKQLREQCEELHESRADAVRELLELKERFQLELSDAQTNFMDDTINGESIDRRLSGLRAEVRVLYCVNCTDLLCTALLIYFTNTIQTSIRTISSNLQSDFLRKVVL